MKSNIFFQLEDCRFENDVTLEECGVLVNFFPKKVAIALKALVKKDRKMEISIPQCESCRDIYEDFQSLTEVKMEGNKLLCVECHKIWKSIQDFFRKN